MGISADLYAPGRSWLHTLDPRVKLWGTFLGIIAGLATADPFPLLGGLVGLNALLLCCGVPFRRLRWIWGAITPIMVLILVLQPWFAPSGTAIFRLGPLHLTVGGITSGLTFAVRVALLAFIVATPLLSTRQDTLVHGMVKLGLPYTWGLTITLSLHYLPTAYEMFQNIRQAQEVRGWTSGRGNLFERARSYMPILVGVVISSLRLADQLALAMAARGLGAGPRTPLHEIKMRPADWGAAFAITAITAAFLAGRLAGR